MPVILPDEAYDLWLDPGVQKTDAVCDLLKPFNPALMRRYEVSSRVNLVKNDDAACAEPVVREAAGLGCRITPMRKQQTPPEKVGLISKRSASTRNSVLR